MSHDVFISYAHIDNASLFEDQPKGWIDRFHYALDMRLQQLVGGPVTIWRDGKLSGGDYFDDAIKEALLDSAILVAILSPRYLNSEWCMKELTTFLERNENLQNIRTNKKPAIFKVVKTPVSREQQSEQLQRILEAEFFEREHATGKVREFWVDQPETRQKFTIKLDDVAQEIHPKLIAARSQYLEQTAISQHDDEASIFLAKTTDDLQVQEDQLRRELKQNGHKVILGETLPENREGFEKTLKQVLHEANLSIHPIGVQYEPIVELQVEQAVQQSQVNGLQCVLWIPKGAEPDGARQNNFHTYLREEIAGKPGVILLEPETLEVLKNDIQEVLQPTPMVEVPTINVQGTTGKSNKGLLTVRFV